MRNFVNSAVRSLGMESRWEDQGVQEKGYLKTAEGEKQIVAVAPRYFRPAEVESLLGDPSKARDRLGWVPRTMFDEFVVEMVNEDMKSAERDNLISRSGYKPMSHFE